MNYLLNIITSSFSNVMFLVFLITLLGYLIGRIEIKGVGLGTAGVFLVALLFGHFGYADDSLLHQIGLVTASNESLKAGMNIMQNMGLLCFVTSVGFIAGPNFFSNLRKNAKSYVLIAAIIIGTASLVCALIIKFTKVDSAMAVGILSGALTTTPGFSAAQDVVRHSESLLKEVTVGYAIGYPFGVIGVVLFVQLVPKLMHADIAEEAKKITAGEQHKEKVLPQGLLELDPVGLAAFVMAITFGIILGKFHIPLPGGSSFSLGNTGGALIMGLILGHFGHVGKIKMNISEESLQTFREFGLVLFLIGAGVPGGSGFVSIIQEHGFILFIYGALMEIAPMILGFFVAKKLIKLCLFNNLGSITGGMTSTPALGALISTAKTTDVAAAYAATYPFALVFVVLAAQFLVTFL